MAGTITHSWNGTVLTVTSDSGTSSADLAGTMGPRGPQGPAGVILNSSGTINMNGYATEVWVNQRIATAVSGGTVDLTNYYTKSETDVLLAGLEVDVDLTGYATTDDVAQAVIDKATTTYVDNKVAGLASETFVTNKIAEAQLSGGEGGDIDLTGYATKDDLNLYALKTEISGFTTMSAVEAKGYQTAEQVQAAINAALAALDGDEVNY